MSDQNNSMVGLSLALVLPYKLTFSQPSFQNAENVFDFFRGHFAMFGDAVPLGKTFSAAAGGGMLSNKNRMAAHRRLLPVVFRFGRSEPLRDKRFAMF